MSPINTFTKGNKFFELSKNDYYPGGMLMPGRKYSIANTNYRYGFNGKEHDKEVKGDGNLLLLLASPPTASLIQQLYKT